MDQLFRQVPSLCVLRVGTIASRLACTLGLWIICIRLPVTRQKVGGTNLGGYIIEQLPGASHPTYEQSVYSMVTETQ